MFGRDSPARVRTNPPPWLTLREAGRGASARSAARRGACRARDRGRCSASAGASGRDSRCRGGPAGSARPPACRAPPGCHAAISSAPGADARKLQELRRVHRAGGQDDLAPRRARRSLPPCGLLHPDRPPPLEQHSRRVRLGDDPQVRPPHRRPEIRRGGRGPHAVPRGDLVEPDALACARRSCPAFSKPSSAQAAEIDLAERMHAAPRRRRRRAARRPREFVRAERVVLRLLEIRRARPPSPSRDCRPPPSRRNRRAGRGYRPWR